MGTYTLARPAHGGWLRTWLLAGRTRLVRYWLYRKTLSELSRLDTDQLDDLGLSRSMLKRVARQAVYEAR